MVCEVEKVAQLATAGSEFSVSQSIDAANSQCTSTLVDSSKPSVVLTLEFNLQLYFGTSCERSSTNERECQASVNRPPDSSLKLKFPPPFSTPLRGARREHFRKHYIWLDRHSNRKPKKAEKSRNSRWWSFQRSFFTLSRKMTMENDPRVAPKIVGPVPIHWKVYKLVFTNSWIQAICIYSGSEIQFAHACQFRDFDKH